MSESLRDTQAPLMIQFLWNKILFWIAPNQSSPQLSLALVVKTKISTQSPEHEAWIKHFAPYQNLYK